MASSSETTLLEAFEALNLGQNPITNTDVYEKKTWKIRFENTEGTDPSKMELLNKYGFTDPNTTADELFDKKMEGQAMSCGRRRRKSSLLDDLEELNWGPGPITDKDMHEREVWKERYEEDEDDPDKWEVLVKLGFTDPSTTAAEVLEKKSDMEEQEVVKGWD